MLPLPLPKERNFVEDLLQAGFEYLRPLHFGRESSVHLVAEGSTGSLFVAKVTEQHRVEDLVRKEALRLEAELLSTLRHPHIVGFHKFVANELHYILIQEYCPGGDVFAVLRRLSRNRLKETLSSGDASDEVLQLVGLPPDATRVPASTAADWCVQIGSALSYLHALGVVHCDVKSANIFLSPDGSVKLGDFGSAFLMRNANAAHIAGDGSGEGFIVPPVATLGFVPPEHRHFYACHSELEYLQTVGASARSPQVLEALSVIEEAASALPPLSRDRAYVVSGLWDSYGLGCFLFEACALSSPHAGMRPSEPLLLHHLEGVHKLPTIPDIVTGQQQQKSRSPKSPFSLQDLSEEEEGTGAGRGDVEMMGAEGTGGQLRDAYSSQLPNQDSRARTPTPTASTSGSSPSPLAVPPRPPRRSRSHSPQVKSTGVLGGPPPVPVFLPMSDEGMEDVGMDASPAAGESPASALSEFGTASSPSGAKSNNSSRKRKLAARTPKHSVLQEPQNPFSGGGFGGTGFGLHASQDPVRIRSKSGDPSFSLFPWYEASKSDNKGGGLGTDAQNPPSIGLSGMGGDFLPHTQQHGSTAPTSLFPPVQASLPQSHSCIFPVSSSSHAAAASSSSIQIPLPSSSQNLQTQSPFQQPQSQRGSLDPPPWISLCPSPSSVYSAEAGATCTATSRFLSQAPSGSSFASPPCIAISSCVAPDPGLTRSPDILVAQEGGSGSRSPTILLPRAALGFGRGASVVSCMARLGGEEGMEEVDERMGGAEEVGGRAAFGETGPGGPPSTLLEGGTVRKLGSVDWGHGGGASGRGVFGGDLPGVGPRGIFLNGHSRDGGEGATGGMISSSEMMQEGGGATRLLPGDYPDVLEAVANGLLDPNPDLRASMEITTAALIRFFESHPKFLKYMTGATPSARVSRKMALSHKGPCIQGTLGRRDMARAGGRLSLVLGGQFTQS
uniref:non-specific serine/threonine protein kinase n=1 Tax=Chromera velia CCMP2878 TaxID=1169474 RepID=A0A0G4H2H7_9ALVE|eukprot:Cvel_5589.t1-p1 / transcript=Cvel_5589.t1 / gene=Cvel_5589 / organism=Chromera_velia_CCMP2878 / gene_product=Serine/threonine-protein kinase Nek3, putative / transcript_product=Serine/threonine-protein kinase Nek3, putative / location=Cvel_scaffold263:36052-40297(-) / protein_length=953 / sequence_SO=supercontig / SO=protein_coding / is_pseudo=false